MTGHHQVQDKLCSSEQEGLGISTRTGHEPFRSVRVLTNLDAADNVDRSSIRAEGEDAACQVAKEATDTSCTSGHPSFLLDNCLDRAASLCEKLDRLSVKRSGQSKAEEEEKAESTQSISKPAVVLDRCLARVSSLHGKLDKLSSMVSTSRDSEDITRADDKAIPQFTRPAQHTGLPASPVCLQVNEIKTMASDATQFSPIGVTEKSRGKDPLDQTSKLEALETQRVTAIDSPAQFVGVESRQPAQNAEDGHSSA